jgi:DNA-binding Lrp family transcriptional regulator
MTTAFVMINTEFNAKSEILKSIKEIPQVKEAYLVYGVYDIIAQIETENLQEIKDVISMKIRRIDNVRSTLTMITSDTV